MSKNMKLLRIASLTVLAVLLSAVMVNAEGSQITSSSNGVTISAAADVAEGQLTLSGINETGSKIRLLVKKSEPGSDSRWYKVKGDYDFLANVIFEDGYGKYVIYAMINQEKNVYAYGPSLIVENVENTQEEIAGTVEYIGIEEDTNNQEDKIQTSGETLATVGSKPQSDSIYTKPGKDIASDNSGIIDLSNELTQGVKSDRAKIEAIYTWIVTNLTYDYEKYNRMLAGDYSDRFGSVVALEKKIGVCYDYSTLFAALCRAQGIETKVIKGYSMYVRGYHAWNEVFDSASSEWLILDTTVDSSRYHKNGGNVKLTVKSADEYSGTSEM